MKKPLADFIAEVNRDRKSGLLSIPVKGENKLLKLFFRAGELYYIACGEAKGWSCVAQVGGGEFTDYFFMPDISFNHQDSTLPALEEIIGYYRSIAAAAAPRSVPNASGSAKSNGQPVASTPVLEKLTLALTRQIGPAGAKVVKRVVEQQWNPSAPPSKDDYLQLVEFLKQEIENPEDQDHFIKEASALLA